jgi:hypothetical protein
MNLRRLLAIAAAASMLAGPPALAQNFAGLSAQARSPGGLSWERARIGMPGLQRPTFDRADRNGDGVIDASEWPTLQSLYNALNRSR